MLKKKDFYIDVNLCMYVYMYFALPSWTTIAIICIKSTNAYINLTVSQPQLSWFSLVRRSVGAFLLSFHFTSTHSLHAPHSLSFLHSPIHLPPVWGSFRFVRTDTHMMVTRVCTCRSCSRIFIQCNMSTNNTNKCVRY